MANAVVQQINAEMEELQKQLTQFKSSVEYLNNAKSQVSKAVDTVNKAEENFNQRIKELKDTYHSFIQLSDAVWAVIQKIDTVNFPERLDSIQATIKDTIKTLNEIKEATVLEVQKAANVIINVDFEGKFSKLQSGIYTSAKSNQEFAESIQKLHIPEKIDEFERSISKRINESYKEVERNTKQIAEDTSKSITNLNLPIRIDKLDATIAGISTGIQNIQNRLDFIESNLKDKINETAEKQIQASYNFQEKFLNTIENLRAENLKIQKKQNTISIIGVGLIIVSFLVLFFVKH